MDAIVQLIRNALCCIKDLNLLSDTVLYESQHVETIVNTYVQRRMKLEQFALEDPYRNTTVLEVLISITQLYACLSCMYSGAKLCWLSLGKLKRIVSLLEQQLVAVSSNNKKKNNVDNDTSNANTTAALRLVNESLVKESKVAMKNTFVGVCVCLIGIAFFWLFGHSWHFTEAGIIGGVPGLIDALTVMEVCLLPLLWYMIVDAKQAFVMKTETEQCITLVETAMKYSNTTSSIFNHNHITLARYEFMEPGWVPYWESGVNPYGSTDTTIGADAEESDHKNSHSLEKEMKQVEQTLSLLFPSSSTNDKKKKNEDVHEKEQKIRKEFIQTSVATMQQSLSSLTWTGYREYVYFVINFIAFYGYLMSIVAFYYPESVHGVQPVWIQQLKFHYTNDVADWTGNFAGDLMWTIEPMIVLVSPYYIRSSSSKATKPVVVAAAPTITTTATKTQRRDKKSKKE